MNFFDEELKTLLTILSEEYLDKNPEKFNINEKLIFRTYLKDFLDNGYKSKIMRDEVYDYFVFLKLFNLKPRHEKFANYVTKKYSILKSKRVLDIGSGRTCKLATPLINAGFEYNAIDPQIRLNDDEVSKLGIKSIKKDFFFCKEYSQQHKPSDVNGIDLLVAVEPCLGAEHVIRRGLEKDIPFEVLLCYENHQALDGRTFKTPEDWFKHLESISKEVKIKELNDGYHASNV